MSPLDQYRMLMQLQHATQQANVDEFKKKLGLNGQQLKKLSEVFNKPGGLVHSSLPSYIQQLAKEHPELIEQAIDIQQQLQRLQQNRPDVAPSERSTNPKLSSTDEIRGVPDESGTQPPRDVRRPNTTPLLPDSQRSLSSSPQEQTSSGSTQPAPQGGGQRQDARKELKEVLEHFSGGRDETETSAGGRETTGNTGSAAVVPNRKQRSSLPPNLTHVLEQHGAKSMLKHVLRNARQRIGRADMSGSTEQTDSSSSIWNRTITSAVDFVREDVADFVDDRRRQQAQDSSTDGSRFLPPSPQQQRNNSPSRQPAQPMTAANSPAAADPLPLSLDDALPKLPDDISAKSVFPFLLVVGTVVAVLLLASRHQVLRQSSRTHFRYVPVKPGDIRSREDVVRAFHWLTEATVPDFAEWWHHRRALETMLEYSPERNDAFRQLAELYEVARYDLNDESFDEARLQHARDALAGCLA